MTDLASIPYATRRALARDVRLHIPNMARQVTDDFFHRYPEWLERYGLAGVERGVEDARFHAEFLVAAIEIGRAEAFADYLRWARRVLEARHIDARFLLENVAQVRDALAEQVSDEARALLVDVANQGLSNFEPEESSDDPALPSEVAVYMAAALSGQRTAALNIAREAARNSENLSDLYTRLLEPAQQELGRLWELNRISVAQEHLASSITQHVVSQLYSDGPPPDITRGKLVVCGVEGELHQLGAQMLADTLEAEGWEVRFLGSHLPGRDVVRFVGDHGADLLAISVTMIYHIPRVVELIEAVRERYGDSVRIVIGGRAFRANPSLCEDMDADGCALDLPTGLALIRRLSGS